jgi:hypothetical protein
MKSFVCFAAMAFATSFGAVAAQASDIEGPPPYEPPPYGAQGYVPAPYGSLPPYEVVTIIRSMGFNPQSRPVLRGRVYVIHAIDNHGIPLRVAVDARSGRVVRVIERVAGAGYGPLPPDRYGAYPVPPSAVPNGAYEMPDDEADLDGQPPDYRAPANVYPRPIYPQSSKQPAATAPRVASRPPSAAPTPRAKPQTAPATQGAKASPPGASPEPEAVKPQPAPPVTTSSIEDSGRPGKSVPAPVASRKTVAPPAEAPAAKSDAPAKTEELKLVPVAPLE